MSIPLVKGRIVGRPNIELTPEDAARIGAIMGTWYGPKSLVVSGRDYSPASRMIKRAFISGLMSTGVEVMDFHEAVAGEISYAIKRFGARGGVNVSAYPLREDCVQLRIFTSPGHELVGKELENIVKENTVKRVDPKDTGWVVYAEYIHELYSSALLSVIDSDAIMSRKPRVVISTGYGPSDKVLPQLLSNLGIDFISLNTMKPPVYRKLMYPLEEDIIKVSNVVRATNADIGVVFNTDASTILIIDDRGRALLPEEVVAIMSLRFAKDSRVVYSKDVFGFIKNILINKGIKVVETDIIDGAMLNKTVEIRPVLGFNGVGEYIHPILSLGYDGILTMLKVLEVIAVTEKKLSTILKSFTTPRYYVIETPLSLREAIEKTCRETDYCRIYIGGCRLKLLGQNIVLTIDPVTSTTRVLIDAYAQNIEKLIQIIHKTLS
ncbi:phosphoglucomutase [Desulfurococcaceae archaeon MEX13E-LK6-19]|nr:phosphoglucomutase [Desulfurococcaceae archaeon MEX13E-LK6-19]